MSNFAPYIPSQIADISGLGTALSGKEPTLAAGTSTQFYRGDKTWQTLNYLAVAGLSTVAHTGAYADLSGVPSLAAVALSGAYTDLSGRPTLATVATTGAYSDLTGKPTLFSGAFSALTGIPTTIAGYGITDAYTKAQADAQYKPIAYQPAASNISDATTAGRSMLTATDATAQKTLLSLQNVDNTSDATKQTSNDGRYGRLSVANTWALGQTFGGAVNCKGISFPDNVNAYNFGDATNKGQDIYFKGALYGNNIACGAGSLTVYGMRTFSFTTDVINTVLLAGGNGQDTVLRPYDASKSLAIYGFASQTVPLLRMDLPSSTSTQRKVFAVTPSMPTTTDASRTGRTTLAVTDFGGDRECVRMEATGTAPAIGFLGASAITKRTLNAAATDAATTMALTNQLRQLFIDLGLAQ